MVTRLLDWQHHAHCSDCLGRSIDTSLGISDHSSHHSCCHDENNLYKCLILFVSYFSLAGFRPTKAKQFSRSKIMNKAQQKQKPSTSHYTGPRAEIHARPIALYPSSQLCTLPHMTGLHHSDEEQERAEETTHDRNADRGSGIAGRRRSRRLNGSFDASFDGVGDR